MKIVKINHASQQPSEEKKHGRFIESPEIDHVLVVAAKLFAEFGFEGIGIRRIAQESGVTMPSLFRHFISKECLYNDASVYIYETAIQEILEMIERSSSPEKKLEQIIGRIFDRFLQDRTFFLLVPRYLTDAAAWRNRPTMVRESFNINNLIHELLIEVFDFPIEKRLSFSLISLILGFCELTVAQTPSDSVLTTDSWLDEQRAYLIEISKRCFFGREALTLHRLDHPGDHRKYGCIEQ